MNVKQNVISGVRWNGVGNIIRQTLQFPTMLIFARILTPEDFGIYAVLLICIGFTQMLSSMGTAQVIIFKDDTSSKSLSSILIFGIIISLVLASILFSSSTLISYYFKMPLLKNLLRILSFTIVINSFGIVQRSLLQKEMRFREIVTIESISLLLASVAGIIAAIKGFGVYSMVLRSALNTLISTTGFWFASKWKPELLFSLEELKKIWSYSTNLTGFNIINYFSRNVDTFVIGKYISSSAVGNYSLAYRFMLFPIQNISDVITRVLFPALSKLKHDNLKFRNIYLKSISMIALFTFPLMAGIFVLSDQVVVIIFGDKWEDLSTIIRILAPIGMIQSIATTVGSIYTSKGTVGMMVKMGLLNTTTTSLFIIMAIPFGVTGIAMAYGLANILLLFPNLLVSWRQIDLRVFDGIKYILPFFSASIFMSVALYILLGYQKTYMVPLFISTGIIVICGIVIYILILMVFHRSKFLVLLKNIIYRHASVNG